MEWASGEVKEKDALEEKGNGVFVPVDRSMSLLMNRPPMSG